MPDTEKELSGGLEGRTTSGISRRNAVTLAVASALGAAGGVALAQSSPVPPPRERADVRAFGAVGDGVTDDTQALRDALAASPCVELPHGTYSITQPLEINSGQILLGCGSTLRGAGNHVGIRRGWDPRFGDQLIEFPVIRDLRLENFSIGLQAEGMSWGDFQNLVVARCGIGYRLATGNRGTCYYNTFTSCHVVGEEVGVGVLFQGMRNLRFEDLATGEVPVVGANGNFFQGCKIGGESTCLDIHGPVKGLVFTGCSIERGRPGVTLLALGTTSDAETCDGCGQQCGVGICAKCKVTKVAFFGCNFEGGGEAGGSFQKGRLCVGQYAEDCSFFGSAIPGGVEVEDDGNLTNWFPLQGCGGIQRLFAIEPANAYARVGSNEEGKFFNSLNARTVRMDLDGRVEWRVPGTSPQDVVADISLYRSGPSLLRTDQKLCAQRLLGRTLTVHDEAERATVHLEGGLHRLRLVDQEDRSSIVLEGTEGRITARCFTLGEVAVAGARPGDVLVIAPNGKMRRCTRAADTRVSGVVVRPSEPGGAGGRQASVAAAGSVSCRVDARYGAVRAGDLLTTSRTRGHAMRIDDPAKAVGAILGKALEPLSRGSGIIRVLVTLQ